MENDSVNHNKETSIDTKNFTFGNGTTASQKKKKST